MSNSNARETNPIALGRDLAVFAVGAATASVTKEVLRTHLDEPETRSARIKRNVAIYGVAAATSLAASHAVRTKINNVIKFADQVVQEIQSKKAEDNDDVTPA